MKNLFDFIWRNYFTFLFLILEFISIKLVVEHNSYQQSSYYNTVFQLTGSIYTTYQDVNDYFSLKQVNRQLAAENARLRAMTHQSMIVDSRHINTVSDTVYKLQYHYLSARVVNNSVNKGNNFIMIDKGYVDGIRKDMGVITGNGVVGIVKDVSENFSYIISVLNKKFKLSGKIKKNNQYGSITWDGMDFRYASMEDVPTHARISKGDLVITSGNSYFFPEGIPVGTIDEVKTREGESFYDIRIRFTEDYNSLHYVYVITNMMKDEQQQLESRTPSHE